MQRCQHKFHMVFLKTKQNQERQGFQFNCIEYIHAGHKKNDKIIFS